MRGITELIAPGEEILPDAYGWDRASLQDIAAQWLKASPDNRVTWEHSNRSLTLSIEAQALPGLGKGVLSSFVVQRVLFQTEVDGTRFACGVQMALPDAVERYTGKAMLMLL
jgi:hypothetical protein